MTTPAPHRRDFNYSFPPGLFPAEVDLEGSAQAYHSLIDGLENCSDLQQLLNQVDADPFRSNNIFNELDLDIFDQQHKCILPLLSPLYSLEDVFFIFGILLFYCLVIGTPTSVMLQLVKYIPHIHYNFFY